MADTEKQARELHEAARNFYNATVGDPAVTIRCQSGPARDAVTAAGARLRLALLNQHGFTFMADGSQVIPTPAPGAHEVHPKAVDVGLNLTEPGERLLAADALEHADGLPPAHDRQVTPVTLATVKPPRNRRTRLREDV